MVADAGVSRRAFPHVRTKATDHAGRRYQQVVVRGRVGGARPDRARTGGRRAEAGCRRPGVRTRRQAPPPLRSQAGRSRGAGRGPGAAPDGSLATRPLEGRSRGPTNCWSSRPGRKATRAQALILAGKVFSGERRVAKAGDLLSEDTPLEVRGQDHPWVSRGGVKLAHGLASFGFPRRGGSALMSAPRPGGSPSVTGPRRGQGARGGCRSRRNWLEAPPGPTSRCA